jgi:hypothetical protein
LGLYRFSFPAWSPSIEPFARQGRKRLRPSIRLTVIGPQSSEEFEVVVDTGAEFSVFPEWVGWRVGLRRQPNSPVQTVVSSVSGSGAVAWFAPAELLILDPGGVQAPHRWPAIVGFTPAASFSTGPIAGVLGVNGGLDRFQRVEFDWSALGGPEVVLRT